MVNETIKKILDSGVHGDKIARWAAVHVVVVAEIAKLTEQQKENLLYHLLCDKKEQLPDNIVLDAMKQNLNALGFHTNITNIEE